MSKLKLLLSTVGMTVVTSASSFGYENNPIDQNDLNQQSANYMQISGLDEEQTLAGNNGICYNGSCKE